MSRALVIASREIRERGRLFIVAAALATVPFLVLLAPSARRDSATAISAIGGFLALALALGVAVAFGTSTVSGEMAQRRLAFYFSRPISPAALWSGKAVAAVLTSLACFAIVALPSLVATGSAWRSLWVSGGRLAGMLVLGTVVLFLISHVLGTLTRSRSALIAIDFVASLVAVGATLMIARPIIMGGGGTVAARLLTTISVALLVILAAAPVWQLSRGRDDLRRSHAALSQAIWVPLAIVLLVAAIFVAWFVGVAPRDLAEVRHIDQPASGNAFVLSGAAPRRGDFTSTFIVDGDSSFERTGWPSWWGSRFSRDGRYLAWFQPSSFLTPGHDFDLYMRRLDQPGAKAAPTGLHVFRHASFVLSDDGSRVAIADRELLSVFELPSRKLLASARGLAVTGSGSMWFASNDLLRVVESDTRKGVRPLKIYELDIPSKKFSKTGETQLPMKYPAVSASADSSRMLVRGASVIIDGRTAQTVATLPLKTGNGFGSLMLHDGSVAVLERVGPGRTRLHLFDRNGAPVRVITLPMNAGWISGEAGDRRLLVSGSDGPNTPRRKWRVYVIDLARGIVERTVTDVRAAWPGGSIDPRARGYAEGTKIVGTTSAQQIVKWDPATGTVTRF